MANPRWFSVTFAVWTATILVWLLILLCLALLTQNLWR